MATMDSRWRVTTTLEFTIPIGSHVDEVGKALAVMRQEMEREKVTGDIFVAHDDDHVVLTARVTDQTFSQRPQFTTIRTPVQRAMGVYLQENDAAEDATEVPVDAAVRGPGMLS